MSTNHIVFKNATEEISLWEHSGKFDLCVDTEAVHNRLGYVEELTALRDLTFEDIREMRDRLTILLEAFNEERGV